MRLMAQLNLSPRLLAAAEFVDSGTVAADVGTDHAYLPVYLIQSGKCERVIASDVRTGPLDRARETVERFALSDKISLRLSDGLLSYEDGEASQIVICGMGGELIAQILSAADWVKSQGMHLVLQPMSQPDTLRRFLCDNGFFIEAETAVQDSGRFYTVISARYDGKAHPCDELFAAIGALSSVRTPESAGYKALCIRRLQQKIQGLRRQNEASEDAARYEILKQKIEETV